VTALLAEFLGVALGNFRTVVSQFEVEQEGTGEVANFMLPRLCNHCDNPPCVPACPVQATYQRQDGIVVVESEISRLMDKHRDELMVLQPEKAPYRRCFIWGWMSTSPTVPTPSTAPANT
jgi:nitrate reductase beta subunit